VTFGLSTFIANLALLLWSPNYRLAERSLKFAMGNVKLLGIHVGIPEIIASVGSIVIFAIMYYITHFTKTGRAIQATAIDPEGAQIVGINIQHVYTITFGLGVACVGAAGVLLATFYYIFPYVGSFFAMIAFATVALGGFGSIEGSFVAGILIGIIEALGGFFYRSSCKIRHCVYCIYDSNCITPRHWFVWLVDYDYYGGSMNCQKQLISLSLKCFCILL